MLEEAVVSRPVTILAQPFTNTVVYGRPAKRAFRVVNGAALDLRFVTMYFGIPDIYADGALIIGQGMAIRVQGGSGKRVVIIVHFNSSSIAVVVC